MQAKVIVFALLGLFLLATTAAADVPRLINYQGSLTDDDGIPIDDDVEVIFGIYDDPIALEGLLWSENRTCTVRDGLFSIVLGEANPIPDTVFDSSVCWLQVIVEGQPLSPRKEMVSVGYAFRSIYADTAGYALVSDDGDWTRSGDTLYVIDEHVAIGTTQPWAKFGVEQHDQAGVVVRSTTDGDVGVGYKYAGLFDALDAGGGNAGVIARAGCIGLSCTPAGDNVGIWAIYTEGGRDEPIEVPFGNWAGYFEGKTYFSDYVGIGETNPTHNLDVAGVVRVQDDLTVVDDATVQDNLTVDGKLILNFESGSGNYDSGWLSMYTGQTRTLNHNLLGSADNYIVYMDGKNDDGKIHHWNYGSSCYTVLSINHWVGCEWGELTNTQIQVHRADDDEYISNPSEKYWDYVRIRILANQ